jgi:hypothetical protein
MTIGRPKGEPLYPVTLSIPVSVDAKDRLSVEAEKRGIAVATHARWLIMKGLGKR